MAPDGLDAKGEGIRGISHACARRTHYLPFERTLTELSRFATAQRITDILRRRGVRIGTITVYRNLQSMAGQGKLDVIHLNGETLCRACTDRHHHHICIVPSWTPPPFQ